MKVMLNPKIWFKNLLIKNKIFMVFIPLIIIPLFLVAYISNSIFTEAEIGKTIKNTIDESRLIIIRIDNMMNNAESCANIVMTKMNDVILLNEKSMQVTNLDTSNQAKSLELRGQIQNRLDSALIVFPDVESMAFIDVNSNLYCTDENLRNGFEKALNSSILKEIDKTFGTDIWFPVQVRDYLVTSNKSPVITLGKKIINIKTQETLGFLILNLNENSLYSIYNSIGPSKQAVYYIVDRDGNVVSSQRRQDILKPVKNELLKKLILSSDTLTKQMYISGKEMLVTSMVFHKIEWRLVDEIPLEEITADTKKLTVIVIVISFSCLVFALLAAGILSRVIAMPLIKLTDGVNTIRQGNLDVQYKIDSADEVGLLASGINLMVGRIRDLISNVKFEQKKKKEYELALIQAQIKPHFLYNTLDVIYSLAKLGRLNEVQHATSALADFYRIALSKGREIISISEEIKNVTSYLSIQKIRYSDVFDYEINIQQEIMDSEILKLTIQPLVENSIYHGLKEALRYGKIIIEGYRTKNEVIIKVIDNGNGIPSDRLDQILEHEADDLEQNRHFGVSSVDERIKLYFGEEYGIHIASEVGKGTEVTITLPA